MKSFIYCCLLLLSLCGKTSAQNLFANSGFEAINNCTEYKADCAPEAWFNIPAGNFLVNVHKAPKALLGDMVLIVPVGNVMANFNKHRYVYTALCCPLVANKKYTLSFYIHTSTISFNALAVYFTNKEPMLSSVNNLPESPSVIITKEMLSEVPRSKWHFVTYNFTATGSEQFFIFTTKGLQQVIYEMKDAMNKSGDVLYFIDEIKLQSETQVPLCDGYKKTTEQLFAYNNRHTDNITVFKEITPPAPIVAFVNDTVVIPGLLFDVNKSTVKPAVKKIIDSLCVQLQQRKIVAINITGHTDSTGNESNNQQLSLARASAIKNYIADKLPSLTEKITAAGKAAAQPVAPNSTTAGRQRNRRVQVIVTYVLSSQ